jgi:TatD DNase family protein
MIDSHAHVAAEQLAPDINEVVARARAAGVRWIEIGTDVAGSQQAVALAEKFPNDMVGATVGVHPSDVGELTEEGWSTLEELLTHPKVVAVGEVGLDYYRTSPSGLRTAGRGGTFERQRPALERFVALAVAQKMPVVFHVRSGKDADAHADMLEFLRALPQSSRPAGVMHTFSGTWAQAEEYLKLGLYLSLSGVVTFKNAPDMHEVARQAPLDRLLIETDSPYLTPEPHRGTRNEPAYIALVAQKIADLRGISVGEVATATETNALALFHR